MSVAYTRPVGPTTLENCMVHAPNPAPTSATVMPGFSSKSFTSSGISSAAAFSCPSVRAVCWEAAGTRQQNEKREGGQKQTHRSSPMQW